MICQGCGREVKKLDLHHWYDSETLRLQQKHICTRCNIALGYQFGPDDFMYPSWKEQLGFLRERLKPGPDMSFPYGPKLTTRIKPLLLQGLGPSKIARRLGVTRQSVSYVILASPELKPIWDKFKKPKRTPKRPKLRQLNK